MGIIHKLIKTTRHSQNVCHDKPLSLLTECHIPWLIKPPALSWSLSQHHRAKAGSPWTNCQFITGLTYRDEQPFTLTGNLESPINLPPVYMFFGLWEETGVRGINPRGHGENIQTLHRNVLTWFSQICMISLRDYLNLLWHLYQHKSIQPYQLVECLL